MKVSVWPALRDGYRTGQDAGKDTRLLTNRRRQGDQFSTCHIDIKNIITLTQRSRLPEKRRQGYQSLTQRSRLPEKRRQGYQSFEIRNTSGIAKSLE